MEAGMSPKMRIVWLCGFVVLVGAIMLALWVPLRAFPGRQTGIDLERFAALKARVDDLRRQGYDVSRLESTIADVEYWIAQGKAFEANLRIGDLEADLSDPRVWGAPPLPPQPTLPPAPPPAILPEAGDTVLLQEDFGSPQALNSWQSVFLSHDPGNMARWEIRQNALYLNTGAGGMQTVGLVNLIGNEEWTDYVYQVDLYALGNLEMGVVFRYLDGNFYRFRFLSWEYQGVPTRILERVEEGRSTVLATADGPGYQTQRWYSVQVVVRGPQITVYLDGQPILQTTDGQIDRGKVGVFALSLGDVYFDNVRVATVR